MTYIYIYICGRDRWGLFRSFACKHVRSCSFPFSSPLVRGGAEEKRRREEEEKRRRGEERRKKKGKGKGRGRGKGERRKKKGEGELDFAFGNHICGLRHL